MIAADGSRDLDDPLAPDNPLAIPLVETLRELVDVKRALMAAHDDIDAYRLLGQVAMGQIASQTKEIATARRTIERLRNEFRITRDRKAA